MIKAEGTQCPFCNQRFAWRMNAKYLEKKRAQAQEANKERHCSTCGSTKTKKASGYPIWLKDGNGGWLCELCYRRQKG